MAGMDWFRWHHGSVTDPKFQLVARKTKSRVADVIAVWAFILETASQSNEQGVRFECDHIYPIVLGGSNAIENLATACVKCNRSKGSKTLAQWEAVRGW